MSGSTDANERNVWIFSPGAMRPFALQCSQVTREQQGKDRAEEHHGDGESRSRRRCDDAAESQRGGHHGTDQKVQRQSEHAPPSLVMSIGPRQGGRELES